MRSRVTSQISTIKVIGSFSMLTLLLVMYILQEDCLLRLSLSIPILEGAHWNLPQGKAFCIAEILFLKIYTHFRLWWWLCNNHRRKHKKKTGGNNNLFYQICSYSNLNISVDKSVAVLFSNNLLEKRHLIFKTNNQKINIAPKLTYLGNIFGSKF